MAKGQPGVPGGPGNGGGGGGGGGGSGHGGGGGGGGGGHGGGGGGGGSGTGDLYGDQYVVLRDLNSTDGGGNGEPVLDGNGNLILVGTDGAPVYFVEDPLAEGDYVLDPARAAFAETVELGRANVARSPDSVMQKSLDSALGKIDAATTIDTDAAGRLVLDGVTIDSPLENLALYQYLMGAGGHSSWPDVTEHWPLELQALLGSNTQDPDWSPASLLGAAFDKAAPISMDAVLYENTVLGINAVTPLPSGGISVDYFDFSGAGSETFNYDRADHFAGDTLQWYQNIDDDPDLELVTGSVMDAVFGGQDWSDSYITLGSDPNTFVTASATTSGTNDFAQAVEDARAVINFMHTWGATLVI